MSCIQKPYSKILKPTFENLKSQNGSWGSETILDRKRRLFYIRSFFCESLRLQNHLQTANLLFGAPRFRFGLFICFFIKIQCSPYKNLVFGNVFSLFLVQCCVVLLFFLFSYDIWCRTKVFFFSSWTLLAPHKFTGQCCGYQRALACILWLWMTFQY